MASRLNLQTMLESIAQNENVYFQPPSSVHMKYPAIIYRLDKINNKFANNKVYFQKRMYKVIVVDEDPESSIAQEISKLPSVISTGNYVSDNLNHFAFTLPY